MPKLLFAALLLSLLFVQTATAQSEGETDGFESISDEELIKAGLPTREERRKMEKMLKGMGEHLFDSLGTFDPNVGNSEQALSEADDERERTLDEQIAEPNNVIGIVIDLAKTPLTRLPDGFENLSDLKILVIGNLPSGAEFDFPDAFEKISKLTQLEELHIISNGPALTRLSPALSGLSELRVLDCFDNAIEEIPSELGNLAELRELSLEKNQIASLPESLKELRNVRRLGLSANLFGATEEKRIRRSFPTVHITFTPEK
jgi:Leucine-rich repeat (LRR) protein